jgi:ATP-binding cassette subfamily B protein
VIADKFNVLQMGVIASERVFKVLDNPDVLTTNGPGSHKPATLQGKIEFDRVVFEYTPGTPVLRDISFSAAPGETLAIVGHTGSGKSTIISLLTRLYEVQSGQIRIDDIPVTDYDVETLRSHVGVVLQDVFLFSGSVFDNITLRNPHITRTQVEEVAKMIDLHDFIMSLPGGYDFDVRERGATLSLGQRQLISFIRALLYNPSILVLDEATSSVDTESELLIQRAIDKLIANRTAVVIAHRLSTIRKANKIIVLEDGLLIESGTHQELLAQKGYYAKLCEIQFSGAEAAQG